jgi:multidrug resistance protein, MATE family
MASRPEVRIPLDPRGVGVAGPQIAVAGLDAFVRESRILWAVAGPIILSQLGAVGMNTMDTIMVGPLGPEALAAVGLSSALHMALLLITTGTLLGMGPLVSQAYGAGSVRRCRRVLVQGLWLALGLSLPVFAVNRLGEQIALATGQDAVIAGVVGGYMGALAWGVPPLLFYFCFRQYLEGMGLTKPAMVITFIGLGFNFVGNSVFIYGAGGIVEPMGAVGSGWATSIVRWAMFAAMVAYVIRHPVIQPFREVRLQVERVLLRRIAAVGAPAGVQVSMEVGLFTFAAVMMGWFGPVELGTHQVTINIAATTFMVALGVSMAGGIQVGQRIGARQPEAMRRMIKVTYGYVMLTMGFFAILFLTVPQSLMRLYTSDPEVIALGASLLLMAALFQLFDGGQVAGFCVLRGAADTRVPMYLAAVAYWGIGAPSAYFLGFHTRLGPVGIWAGLVIGLAMATVLLTWRVHTLLGRPARQGQVV